jgi:hypothetical protein
MPEPLSQPIAETAVDLRSIFPEDPWIYDPISRSGVFRGHLGPCECGSTLFVYAARAGVGNSIVAHVCCVKCREVRRHRMTRKGDVLYGRLDVASGIAVFTKTEAEVRRLLAESV